MTTGAQTAGTAKTTIQVATLFVSALFLVVGVLGFVPGVTTHYGSMNAAGHHSGAMLLGLFNVSVLHNVVHLLFGVAGLLLARTAPLARAYLIGGGVIYLVLFVYGLVIDHDGAANFIPLNTADNWLHLGLAVGMIGLGLLLGSRAGRTTATATRAGAESEGRVQ